jgi:hypothetical protein
MCRLAAAWEGDLRYSPCYRQDTLPLDQMPMPCWQQECNIMDHEMTSVNPPAPHTLRIQHRAQRNGEAVGR